MTIAANMIEDSVAFHGKRISTLQLKYPRFIHAELMTHRVFSRNASSSRAIPVAKMIEQVRTEPAMPIHWGKNQPGMQAHEELTGRDRRLAQDLWLTAAQEAAETAAMMNAAGAHKQVVNRILEPFLHISVIVTATEFDNWNSLRAHKDAQPEIYQLAMEMLDARRHSSPVERHRDRQLTSSWHLPYVTAEERAAHPEDPLHLAKLSAARCARVSYLTHDGRTPNADEDLALYERLVGSRPLHASPIEHQAYPLPLATQRSNNFVGWRQHREIIESTFTH